VKLDPCGCLLAALLWGFFAGEYVVSRLRRLLCALFDWIVNRDHCREPFLPDEEAWDSTDWSSQTLNPFERREEEDGQPPSSQP
jgi:hypothetical protein